MRPLYKGERVKTLCDNHLMRVSNNEEDIGFEECVNMCKHRNLPGNWNFLMV